MPDMDSDTLTSLLRSKKTQDRIRAAESLDTADATHVPLVLEVLSDSTHYVAAIAARKLAADPPEGIERQIIKAYRERDANGPANDPGCHIRTHLALTFGKLHVHPAIDDLKRGIKLRQWEYVGGVRTDTAVGLRGNCALALSQLAPVDAARDIAVLLYDGAGDPLDRTLEARKAAARALGRLGDQAALVALALRLTYPDGENPEVLAECMDAVVETRDERGMELLKPLLRHDDAHLAAQAALAIARTGLDEAVPLLVDVCDRLRGDLLRAVALSLSAMRTDASRKALREQAASVREEARMAAIEALSTAPDADSRAVLENLAATDTSPRVREAARRSLGG
jgi:HEAT repeat protein